MLGDRVLGIDTNLLVQAAEVILGLFLGRHFGVFVLVDIR